MSGLLDQLGPTANKFDIVKIKYDTTSAWETQTGAATAFAEVFAFDFKVSVPITIYNVGFDGSTIKDGPLSGSGHYAIHWVNGTNTEYSILPFQSNPSVSVSWVCIPGPVHTIGFLLAPIVAPGTVQANRLSRETAAGVYINQYYTGITPTTPVAPYPILPIPGARLDTLEAPVGPAFVGPPTIRDKGAWLGGPTFAYYYTAAVDHTDTPPAPTVAKAPLQNTVYLHEGWQIASLQEWEVQVSSSLEGAIWSDWIPAQVVPGSVKTYAHTNLNLDRFYKYRYRARTRLQETNWSEAAYTGKPLA